ncbi:asparagine synthase (glutamine-hydrolyzing) [Pollutibacter soli]|uniref:asparagine synthase (glutamine-hydrolyzing) n=1 Tax=Pollutibacter soli TaxID=3034157 RepID=UPI003013309E
MCGIAGIISLKPGRVQHDRLQAMGKALQHRGPDGEYTRRFSSGPFETGFLHRRLAIIDRSSAGIQPMQYLDRYTIIHNGEIYNYIEVRSALQSKGLNFFTNSDTEVIAAAYHYFGKNCVDHFDGMFAFAIWDNLENKLFCARDRFGEKPFYYHIDQEHQELIFASEMKALWAAGVQREPDQQVLLQYLTTGVAKIVWQPERTFYKQIFQLVPAGCFELNADSIIPIFEQYWDLDKETIVETSVKQAAEQLQHLLTTSINRRLRSDVSLGTSLSGGLDSSIIAALCADSQDTRFSHNSFSAVFPGFEKDEREYIKEVASEFHLRSATVTPTSVDLVNGIEKMMYHQEEPVGSSSAFAQFMVYRLAMENGITVLLDGQGADEVFSGYDRYSKWFLQALIAKNQFANAKKESAALAENGFLPEWGYRNYVAAKMPGIASYMLERRVAKKQKYATDFAPGFLEANYERTLIGKPFIGKLNDILYFDTMQGPLQELLHYADRNSMAWGREVRLPYLNHDLVQYIFSLPSAFKMRNGFTKWILRNTYRDRLPENITWRKGKTGFETPQKKWMQDPEVQKMISSSREILVERKILSAKVLKKPIVPRSAFEQDNQDWRYWMAGIIYKY